MKTLFESDQRRGVLLRIDGLSGEQKRLWGSMTLPWALSHMGDQLLLAMGEIETRPLRTPLAYFPLKHLALFVLPWPKNAKTAPELLRTRIEDLDAARQRLKELIERFVQYGETQDYARHPLFGQLSRRTWSYLALRHLDHHLRQFGA